MSLCLWAPADSLCSPLPDPIPFVITRKKITPHECEARESHHSRWSLCSLADAPIGCCRVHEYLAYRSFLDSQNAEKNPLGLFLWDLLAVLLYCCWFLHRLRYCFVDIVPWDKFICSLIMWPVYWIRHVQWTLVAAARALTNWMSYLLRFMTAACSLPTLLKGLPNHCTIAMETRWSFCLFL